METLIISHQEVSKLLPMAECVSVMKETFMTLGRGGALQPLRQAVWLPDKKGVLAFNAVIPSESKCNGCQDNHSVPRKSKHAI